MRWRITYSSEAQGRRQEGLGGRDIFPELVTRSWNEAGVTRERTDKPCTDQPDVLGSLCEARSARNKVFQIVIF